MSVERLSGRIVDICNRAEYPGIVEFADGVIRGELGQTVIRHS
jgi:hypothetical protein